MPAPSAQSLRSAAVASYGMPLGPEAIEYLDMLFGEISSAWQEWQDSAVVKLVAVDGAGSGSWSGSGQGGKIETDPFVLKPVSFKNNSPEQLKFTQGLIKALDETFTPWADSYSFTALPFAGTSTATGSNPGNVDATNVPTDLSSAGSGDPLTGIADIWASTLKPPMFDLENPMAKSKELINAIGSAIETAFESEWLVTTMVMDNTLTGAAAPGGVASGLPSNPDGKLV